MPDGRSPIAAATVTVEVPAPIACSGVTLPYAVVVPYSKRTVVASPRGFTRARRVAPVAITPFAESDETDGARGGVAVVNVRSAPCTPPDTIR